MIILPQLKTDGALCAQGGRAPKQSGDGRLSREWRGLRSAGQGPVTHQNSPITRQWGGLMGTSQEQPPSDSRSRAEGTGGRGCRTLSNQQPAWLHSHITSGPCVSLRPQGAPDTRMLTHSAGGVGRGKGRGRWGQPVQGQGGRGRGPRGAGLGTETAQWARGEGWVSEAPRPTWPGPGLGTSLADVEPHSRHGEQLGSCSRNDTES